MEKFKLAAVQMNALRGKLAYNLKVHQKIAQEAARAGCRLIMFPELSVTTHYGDDDVTRFAGEAGKGKIHDTMLALAKKLKVVIGYGICEKLAATNFNSYVLMGPKGILGIQQKIHASQDEYFSFRMGRSLDVFDMGFCRVGISICLDSNFCETWRTLALKGADLLLLPHAGRSGWGKKIAKAAQKKSLKGQLGNAPGKYGIYAADNCVFAAYCNQVDYNGHSTHSGGAYIISPEGKPLAKSEPILDDCWISAELDPALLDKARNSRGSQMRIRRPEVYGEITKMI